MMEFLAQHGPSAATVFFFVFFVGVGIWTYAPRNKGQMTEHGNIPFKE